MKIRTDFVTNSSSSSFVVEITLRDVDGKTFYARIPPYDPDGMLKGSLKCSATDIMNSDSIESLVDLLAKSASGDKWADNPETEETMQEFGENVKEGVADISRISDITLTRTWNAWGEYASSWGWNLDWTAEELPGLAKAVLKSEGEEKEAAQEKLIDYLDHFPGTIENDGGDSFPSGFLKQEITGRIAWETLADSIEKFAKAVVNKKLPNEDNAVETIKIDMQEHKITGTAEYFFRKNSAKRRW